MARWNRKAFDAGVMLLPGVGFDVIPSDCLAAHLVDRLPGADRLTLAFTGQGGVSHGTATTAVQNLHLGGAVRTDGRIRPVPAAYRSLQVDFGAGFVNTVTVPWGDVSTAWYTTGIQDIRVYMQVPGSVHRMMWMSRWFKGLLASDWGQKKLAAYVDENIVGPDATTRATGHATIWGEAGDRHGNLVEARVHTREAYQTTADGALLVLRKVLAGQSHPGYQTPAGAYGPDLVLELEGASREDL
ncbi:MAG: saccharopine dehydrogenase, partial [Myxococcota bacterium]|nr:saccharopine dehydrogenase [Myxococcota bacterium]